MTRKSTLLVLILCLPGCMLHDKQEMPAATPDEQVVFQPPPTPALPPTPEPPPLVQSVPVSTLPVVTPTKDELMPPKKPRNENPEKAVTAAYTKSILSPSTEGYRGGTSSMQHYPYIPGMIYDIYSAPNHPTSLIFPKGEWLAGPPDIDSHYWDVGKQEMGEGDRRQEIITIKPIVAGLDYTAHFFTQSGLMFFCRLRSFAKTSMVSVTWDVPQRLSVSSPRQVGQGSLFPKRQAPDVPVVDPSRLHTAYTIEVSKGRPPWVPLAVYDDGTKTVIKFKDNLGFTAAPAPFAMDSEGKIHLVQFTPYSVPGEPDKGTYYSVQGLWPLLELRGDGGMVVTIKRQTGQPKPYAPTS